MTAEIAPVADFQALPIDMIVATPLTAAVKAQALVAQTTMEFIKSLMKKEPDPSTRYTPMTADFNLSCQESVNGTMQEKKVHLDAPLLSIVPIPHLRIDSITTHFKYEITQVVSSKSETQKGIELSAGAKWLPFVEATLKGNVSSRSSEEATTNRSGVLEITVHASEAPIPEGLARLLSVLAKMAEPKAV